MNHIVFTESENLNEEPFTTSEVISEYAEVKRRSVTKLIASYKNDLELFGLLRFEISKLNGRGRPRKIYKLNEQQATLIITYLDNTEPVRKFKQLLVKQFYEMKQELLKRQIIRESGKEVRLSMTDAIKATGEAKPYDYSNFTRLAYKSAVGYSSTEIKKARNIPKNGVIVDYLTTDELKAVEQREQQIATLNSLGMKFKAIQEVLNNQGVIYQTTLEIKERAENGTITSSIS